MICYLNCRRNVDSKKSEPHDQVGFEPTTLRDLVGCSINTIFDCMFFRSPLNLFPVLVFHINVQIRQDITQICHHLFIKRRWSSLLGNDRGIDHQATVAFLPITFHFDHSVFSYMPARFDSFSKNWILYGLIVNSVSKV